MPIRRIMIEIRQVSVFGCQVSGVRMRLDEFTGVNAGYVLELYERYRQNPDSVDAATRKAFESWTPPAETAGTQPQVISGVSVREGYGGQVTIQKNVGGATLPES